MATKPKTIPDGTAQKVLAVILEDPGVSCSDISKIINIKSRKVTIALYYLRRTGQIQNLGKKTRGASWYPDRPWTIKK